MNWWRQRNARERLSLVAAGALLLVVALLLALKPFLEERRRLSAGLPGLQEDLAWMRAHVGEVEQLRKSAAAGAREQAQPGLSASQVETLLHDAGLREQVTAMQPQADAGITVSFDEIVFADLLALVVRLQDEGRTRVTGMRVNALEARNGRVKAELTLLPGAR
ncbi:MAG: type II secretion system protein GspM [Gammaproteobacteria bacterium]|nr:type II secretion system protein GspM [Gammaproteobacteria bacterium]